MFLLTWQEIIQEARKIVNSFKRMTFPEYQHGRTDVAGVTVVADTETKEALLYFVVVWKNSKGVHCASQLMKDNRGEFFNAIVHFTDERKTEVHRIVLVPCVLREKDSPLM